MGAATLRIERQGFKPLSLSKTKHYIHILYRLSSSTLYQVVYTANYYEPVVSCIDHRINEAKITAPDLFCFWWLINYPDERFTLVIMTIQFYHFVFFANC